FARQVVDIEIEVQSWTYVFRDGKIQDVQPRCTDGRIFAVKTIVSDVAITQRSIHPAPSRECQPAIGDGMRRAIDINPRRSRSIKRIRDLRDPAIERHVPRQADRRLSFKTVSPARSLQLERSVVGNVNLLVGPIDEEQIAG